MVDIYVLLGISVSMVVQRSNNVTLEHILLKKVSEPVYLVDKVMHVLILKHQFHYLVHQVITVKKVLLHGQENLVQKELITHLKTAQLYRIVYLAQLVNIVLIRDDLYLMVIVMVVICVYQGRSFQNPMMASIWLVL